MALTDKLIAIADAVREKAGTTEAMTLTQIAETIAGIETGGGGGIATGSYVFAENASYSSISQRIEHGLGRVPTQMIQLLKMPVSSSEAICSYRAAYIYISDAGAYTIQSINSSTIGGTRMKFSSYETFSNRHTPTDTDFQLFGSYTGLYVPTGYAGEEVVWFVW